MIKQLNIQQKNDLCGIYQNTIRQMYSIAWAYLDSTDDVNDAVYEAYLRYMERMDVVGHSNVALVAKYLFKTLRNKCIDVTKNNHLQDEATSKAADNYDDQDRDSTWEMVYILNELGVAMECINELACADRKMVLDRYLGGLSYKELAEKYNINEKNISVKLSRQRKKIKTCYKAKGGTYLKDTKNELTSRY